MAGGGSKRVKKGASRLTASKASGSGGAGGGGGSKGGESGGYPAMVDALASKESGKGEGANKWLVR